MTEIKYLEKNLLIIDYNYHCEFDRRGYIISLSIYNSEFDNFKVTNESLEIISKLPYLEELEISCDSDQLTDLSPLSSLVTLKKLIIEETNRISDLSPIENLFFLEELQITNGKIRDITSLSRCPNLTVLRLAGNQIEDVNVISSLLQLVQIDLSSNLISVLPDLSPNKFISSLNISQNRLDNLRSIENLNELVHLMFNDNQIEDISFLKSKDKLISLYLTGNQIDNAEYIASHHRLKFLDIDNNRIGNMSFLKELNALERLSIVKNPAEKFIPEYFPSTLRYLNASFLTDFNTTSIEHLHGISYLELQASGINDISFLRNYPALVSVNLNDNQILTASVFIENRNPTYIYLQNNFLNEPFPIYALFEPQLIDLRGDSIAEKQYLSRISSQVFSDDTDSIDHLRKTVALYYYQRKSYDEALGCYYLENGDKLSVLMYFEKTRLVGNEDPFYLKYLILTCIGLMRSKKEYQGDPDIDKLKHQLILFINNSSVTDKLMLKNSIADYNLFTSISQNTLLDFVDNHADKDYPELIYKLALSCGGRQNLDKCLYLYRKLKIANHPFQYNIYRRIMKVLQMNFAYTEEERLAYSTYKFKLNNILQCDIPTFVYKDYIEYSYLQKVTGRSGYIERNNNQVIVVELVMYIAIIAFVVYTLILFCT